MREAPAEDAATTGPMPPARRPARTPRGPSAMALAAVAALALSACADQRPDDAGAEPTSAETAEAPPARGSDDVGLTVSDQWVQAADAGSTAAFATIANEADHPVTIVSVTSPASEDVELHETAEGENGDPEMHEAQGGFTVQPGEQLNLRPGGEHVMFLEISCSLLAGDEVDIALHTAEEQVMSFSAPIRDYSADHADEEPTAGEPEPESEGLDPEAADQGGTAGGQLPSCSE